MSLDSPGDPVELSRDRIPAEIDIRFVVRWHCNSYSTTQTHVHVRTT